MAKISTYCTIRDQRILLNGKLVFENRDVDFLTFGKSAYKALSIDYPKFYKMDNLSKLAFLAAEVLLEKGIDKEDTALVLMNRSGSLDTDVRHQESIQSVDSYFPSPAVFVYTLANICAGEISIRHGLKSENAFFVSDEFDTDTVIDYTDYLLKSGKAKRIICGWVELFSDKYHAVLYLVDKEGDLVHNQESITSIFA